MENGPSTPAQTSASNLNDFGGPGLFSAEKNARAEMDKSAMKERPGSDQSSEKYSMEDIQGEQKRSSGRGSSESSRTLESGDTAKLAAVTPSSASHTMAPPPKPNFKSTPTSAQQPRPAETESNQDSPAQTADESRSGGSRIPTSSKHEKATMRTTNGKRRLGEIDQHQPRNDDSDVKPFNDHAKSLDAFDWMDLETRYHHQMDDFGRQEQEIYRSFEDLCNYFAVWAQTGHSHEVERSFKRLRTQVTLVRHHEEDLEIKRQHYVKVVDAFKSALHLLGACD